MNNLVFFKTNSLANRIKSLISFIKNSRSVTSTMCVSHSNSNNHYTLQHGTMKLNFSLKAIPHFHNKTEKEEEIFRF